MVNIERTRRLDDLAVDQNRLVWRGLVPLRLALSVLTLSLVIASDRGRGLANDVRVILAVLAIANVAISVQWRRSDGRFGEYTRIVFDSILSLAVVFLSTSATSSLVWVALLVPVIEAAVIGPVAAVAIWFAVSLLYTSIRVIIPGATDTSFVSGMQQLLSVGIVGVPLARWSHRTSSSLRMAAVEKSLASRYAFSLRQVGEYVSQLTRVRTIREVDTIVLAARQAVGAERSELLIKGARGRWRLVQADGMAVRKSTQALLDNALAADRPVVASEPDDINAVLGAGFMAAAAVSLGEKREAVWRLWFESRTVNRHDQEALDLLTSAIRRAYRTVAEIERLKAWSEELERRADIDQLTGVLNRRGLERAVRKRPEVRLAALFLDLNRFKLINDEHGHDSGDHVLQAVAGRFQSCLPAGSLLARVGGDEFAIVVDVSRLPDVAGDLAELRKRLEDSLLNPIIHRHQRFNVSVAVGSAEGPPGTGLDELLRLADLAMYDRKRAATGPTGSADNRTGSSAG